MLALYIIMQVSSYPAATFAPIKSAKQQAYVSKPDVLQTQNLSSQTGKSGNIWEKQSFSFWDILDVINPLQHLPVISTVYRKITGDEMGYAARIAGDTLYSGLFGSLISGLVAAVANVFIDSTTGKDIGEHMIASISPGATSSPARRLVAPIPPASTAIPTAPNSAIAKPIPLQIEATKLSQQHNTSLPAIDTAKIQAGVDQYKWQSMKDNSRPRANYWG